MFHLLTFSDFDGNGEAEDVDVADDENILSDLEVAAESKVALCQDRYRQQRDRTTKCHISQKAIHYLGASSGVCT